MFSGDIFMIPLFLPSFQEWTKLESLRDYRKYKFHEDDIYAFGRLIEVHVGGMNLIEIFSYVGKIPEKPDVIRQSGRLFDPVMEGGAFERGRWRFLFDDAQYDKYTASNYENISFLLGTELWKGGEKIPITQQKRRELKQSGISEMTFYFSVTLEDRIRCLLLEQGYHLNYEQTVEERRNEFPKPRDPDKKLKESIAPFHWLSDKGRYSLSLDAGALNRDCFVKYGMLGNGYDWESVAVAFIDRHMADFKGKFTFDCEADTFSMQSATKKNLKEFALAFHQFAADTTAFEELLSQIKIC